MDRQEQIRRAELFVELHRRQDLFILPNPWDLGTAKILEHLGYQALASTSAGHARSLGRPDGQGSVARAEAIAHAVSLAEGTSLPVSGDFENGYGDSPIEAAATVSQAVEVGLAGCCIEDSTSTDLGPIYESALAAERIAACAEAAAGTPFVLVARAENLLHGIDDLGDTIARLRSFQQAGADVVYAPGLINLTDIRAVVESVDVPVNVLIGLPGQEFGLDDLQEIGVRRVSVGSGFYNWAMADFERVARSLLSERRMGPAGPGLLDMDELFS